MCEREKVMETIASIRVYKYTNTHTQSDRTSKTRIPIIAVWMTVENRRTQTCLQRLYNQTMSVFDKKRSFYRCVFFSLRYIRAPRHKQVLTIVHRVLFLRVAFYIVHRSEVYGVEVFLTRHSVARVFINFDSRALF